MLVVIKAPQWISRKKIYDLFDFTSFFAWPFFNFPDHFVKLGPDWGGPGCPPSVFWPPLLMYDNQYDTAYYVFRKDLQKRVCEFLKKVPWPKFYSSKIDSRWTAPKKYLSLPRYCNLFSSLCQYQKLLILWIIYYLFFILSKWL